MVWLDDAVGAILDKLDDMGIAENTIVMVASDQGGKGGKRTLKELGVRMPLMVRWPASIAAGTVCNALAENVDVAATLLDLAGGSPSGPIDGVPFSEAMQGRAESCRKAIYLEFANQRGVVHENGFKYLARRDGAGAYGNDLYDLNSADAEDVDLYDSPEHTALRTELMGMLATFTQTLPHQFAEFNTLDGVRVMCESVSADHYRRHGRGRESTGRGTRVDAGRSFDLSGRRTPPRRTQAPGLSVDRTTRSKHFGLTRRR
jgi:arylsulfatase A-like enzyme